MPRKLTKLNRKKRSLRKTNRRKVKRGGKIEYIEIKIKDFARFFEILYNEILHLYLYTKDDECKITHLFPTEIENQNFNIYTSKSLLPCKEVSDPNSRLFNDKKNYISLFDSKIKMEKDIYQNFIEYIYKFNYDKIIMGLETEIENLETELKNNEDNRSKLIETVNTNYGNLIKNYASSENTIDLIKKIVKDNDIEEQDEEKKEEYEKLSDIIDEIDTNMLIKIKLESKIEKYKLKIQKIGEIQKIRQMRQIGKILQNYIIPITKNI